jgi:hypothetical protein
MAAAFWVTRVYGQAIIAQSGSINCSLFRCSVVKDGYYYYVHSMYIICVCIMYNILCIRMQDRYHRIYSPSIICICMHM